MLEGRCGYCVLLPSARMGVPAEGDGLEAHQGCHLLGEKGEGSRARGSPHIIWQVSVE